MSEAMKNLRAKLTGAAVEKLANSGDGPSPMILGMLEKFGLSPEKLQGYAESLTGAIVGRLAAIDESLQRILANQSTHEMKLAEIESNQRIIMERVREPNIDQFEQMAEHPLDAPIGDALLQNAQPGYDPKAALEIDNEAFLKL